MDWEKIVRVLADMVRPEIPPEEKEGMIKSVLERFNAEHPEGARPGEIRPAGEGGAES